MTAVRPAEKAGAWYAASPGALRGELDRYLAAVDVSAAQSISAAIVPHAGLAFSGPTAARVYAWLQQAEPEVETFIIFGAVHTMRLPRPAIWPAGTWETPLGPLAVDDRLAAKLVDAGVGTADERPHYGDNAIELQAPFLRHCFPRARIVPVATPADAVAVEAGVTTWDVVRRLGVRAVVLGSTDLTHYGRSFGLTPAGCGHKALRWGRENDTRLLDLMVALNAEAIVPTAERDRSACGAGAAAATVAYARAAGCRQGVLLEHTTSHDVMPDGEASHFVGYGAVVFPTGKARGSGERNLEIG